MRKTLIVGNWKMNKTPGESGELAKKIKDGLSNVKQVDIVVCPSFPALSAVYEKIGNTHIKLGAQDMFWEEEGAYTGEVSALMLRESGCKYVIIGHSERRAYFGETDETVNRKVKKAIKWNIIPIMCVGEKLEEREKNEMEDVIGKQLEGSLNGLNEEELLKMVIAYEPIWAIGTGKTATPDQANEVHLFIRNFLANVSSEEVASQIRILYGGSVKPDNISALIGKKHIDGALVGGASLKDDSFAGIVKGAVK